MRSVADDLRRDTVAKVLAMSVSERIALALKLGDADLDRYIRASGRSREQARAELTRRHAEGREPSRAASAGR